MKQALRLSAALICFGLLLWAALKVGERLLGRGAPFLIPTVSEARRAEILFVRAMRGEDVGSELRQMGLVATTHSDAGDEVLRMSELPDECKGLGEYRLRLGTEPRVPILVSAPHVGSDLLTAEVVQSLFDAGPVVATAVNTAHRRSPCAGTADVARLETHYFTSFTRAFARVHPEGRAIQIHGFNPDRRGSEEGRRASAIVSDGTRDPQGAATAIASCLKQSFAADRIALFPADVDELGALSNAQGKMLRKAGFNGFVHMELSPQFRRRLLDDAETRDSFAACLEAA